MSEKDDIKKVLNYIEENIRVTDQTTIEYLDTHDYIDRLRLKQNHIIFGRRGSGKSLLLKSLKNYEQTVCININLEDFKDISFPNSIIQVQKAAIQQILPIVKHKYKLLSFDYFTKSRPIIKRLENILKL